MVMNPQVIFSWNAPLRAYKKRSKKILRFYLAVSLLLSLIIFFFGDRILLIPILTMLFLFYVLTITPPPEIENKITTFGLDTAGVTLRWEMLSHFYFIKKFNYTVLVLVSNPPYFYHAFLVVPSDEIKLQVVAVLSQHLMYVEKPQRSTVDKMVDWITNLIPDDDMEEVEKTPTAKASVQTPLPASL